MKPIIKYLIGFLAALPLLASCQSQDAEPKAPDHSGVYLTVDVAGISNTRSIIEGTSLPSDAVYSIYPVFAGSDKCIVNTDGKGIQVDYLGNDNKIQKPLIIPADTTLNVYAFYPYDGNVYSSDEGYYRMIYPYALQDYLWGRSIAENGNLTPVTADNPHASLKFEHILARITINFRRGENNDDTYNFYDIWFLPTDQYAYQLPFAGILYNVISGKVEDIFECETVGIPGEPLNGQNLLDETHDLVTVDYLIIPSTASLSFGDPVRYALDGVPPLGQLPNMTYEAGKQYVFDVTLHKKPETEEVYLSISDVQITPWQENTMPGIDVEVE